MKIDRARVVFFVHIFLKFSCSLKLEGPLIEESAEGRGNDTLQLSLLQLGPAERQSKLKSMARKVEMLSDGSRKQLGVSGTCAVSGLICCGVTAQR